jgi:predicted alpha/beta-hydrolase family hydrolase
MSKAQTLILFAHGAGKGSDSEWMQSWAKRLGKLGKVITFDYPYMAAGRKAPDRLPKLIEAHREQLQAARKRFRKRTTVILCGKSMGSRVGCHLSLEEDVDGVVCLGYPLQGMGKPEKLRDAVLKQLRTPILFVQGTRDSLCPLDTLAKVRKTLKKTRHELHVVETGNHSLTITKGHTKTTGQTQDDMDRAALEAIKGFVESL